MNSKTIFDLLPNYFRIIKENQIPKYIKSKYTKVFFKSDETYEDLYKKHKKYTKKYNLMETLPEESLLDLKIELAERIYKNCVFCENRCKVNRYKEHGRCNVKNSTIASEFLHTGEERVLIPSHTIFFSGCTFKCVFCQNYDISQKQNGFIVKPKKLAEIINIRQKQGSINVNWVGGDPTPNLLFILKTLKELEINIPMIWNSNMYCSIETMELLKNVIDLYLTDFKYGNNKCAEHFSKIKKYMETVQRNHIIAYQNSEMIIRHLVMPNHINCCSKPIIDFISEKLPHAVVNIMAQYHPEYKAYEYPDISRNVRSDEVMEVKKYAQNKNVFVL